MDYIVNHPRNFIEGITRDEIKAFTRYAENKNLIDAKTGYDNLDFPYKEALVGEYTIHIIMNDDSHIYLPINLTDGKGLGKDGRLHRPLIGAEKKELEQHEAEVKQREAKKQTEEKAQEGEAAAKSFDIERVIKEGLAEVPNTVNDYDKHVFWGHLEAHLPEHYRAAVAYYHSATWDGEKFNAGNKVLEKYLTDSEKAGKKPTFSGWLKINKLPSFTVRGGEIKLGGKVIGKYEYPDDLAQ